MSESRTTLDGNELRKSLARLSSHAGSQGAFITGIEIPPHPDIDNPSQDPQQTQDGQEAPEMLTEGSSYRPILSTRLGVTGEINVINGILERMKGRTKKINPKSPRTKQAMENLGIPLQDCLITDFESFNVQGKNEKMSKLLYTYYIGNVNDTIAKVLKERERIRKKGKKNSVLMMQLEPSEYYSPRQTAMTEKAKMTPYGMLSFDRKLDRLGEKKQVTIEAIERRALTYLEEERDYLKQIEKLKTKQEKVEENRKQKEEKRQKVVVRKQEKYSQSVEKIKKLALEKEDEAVKQSLALQVKSARDFKRILLHETLEQKKQHRARQLRSLEEQRKIEVRLEENKQKEQMQCDQLMEHLERKNIWSRYITEREILKKRASMDNLKEKFEKTRDHALSVRNDERVDSYRQYAEKMTRFQEDNKKRITKKDKLKEITKQSKDEHLVKVHRRLKTIQEDLDRREEVLAEKVAGQTARLEKFYITRNNEWQMKTDLNKFRMHRSQIHFNKVYNDNTHKCNVIMKKTKDWKESQEKKKNENEIVRDAIMQHHFKIRSEEESLRYYLEQMSKIHAKTDLIAGKLQKAESAFNTKNMATYISNNFNLKSRKVSDAQESEH